MLKPVYFSSGKNSISYTVYGSFFSTGTEIYINFNVTDGSKTRRRVVKNI